MKHSKIAIIIILFIIFCIVSIISYKLTNLNLTTAKFKFIKNIDFTLSYPNNFHADVDVEAENSYNRCVYSGLEVDSIIALYLANCEYNLEGYTSEQYVSKLEKNFLDSYKRVSQEYMENSQNYSILKTEYEYFDTLDFVPNYIQYTILYNNVFYNFETQAISKELHEKYKSTMDTIMKSIKIDDSSYNFNCKIENTTTKETPYYYSLLSEEDKKIYNDILKVFKTYKTIKDGTKYTISCTKPFEHYIDILYALENDYIEYKNPIFYSFDCDYDTNKFSTFLDFGDDSNISNYNNVMSKIDEVANSIIDNMPSNLTKYGKYKYLAESICNIAEYDYSEEISAYGIDDVFLNKKTQCTGYADAFQYLCNKSGLFCTQISGSSEENNSGHVWNVIKLNNEYYYIDVTWMKNNSNFEIFSYKNADAEHNMFLKNLYSDAYKPFLNTGIINWQEEKYLLKNNNNI